MLNTHHHEYGTLTIMSTEHSSSWVRNTRHCEYGTLIIMSTEHSRAKVYYTFNWRYAIPLVGGTLYLWSEVHYTFDWRYTTPLVGGTLYLYLRALALPSFGWVERGSPLPSGGVGGGPQVPFAIHTSTSNLSSLSASIQPVITLRQVPSASTPSICRSISSSLRRVNSIRLVSP